MKACKIKFADFFMLKIYKSKKKSLLKQSNKGNIPALLLEILHNQTLIYEAINNLKGKKI